MSRGAVAVLWVLLCLGPCVRPASAERLAELGEFERESVTLALEELKLEVEPSPEGKRLGRVRVRNFEVFGDKDSAFLR